MEANKMVVAGGSPNFEKMVDELRETFKKGQTRPYEYRLNQLINLQKLLEENSDDIERSLHKDLRRHKMESAGELLPLKVEVSDAIRLLSSWMQPDKLPTCLLLPNDRAYLQHDPYGVVLIIGTWNYPVLLTLNPLVGAIAAGNCAVLKLSDGSPSTSAKLAELLPQYLDTSCIKVVMGGAPEATALLKVKFDYLFATCSSRIGRKVMAAAVDHLTPVTLELGGKCPLYMHDSADIEIAAKRIIWGKMINNGQSCIAPDYILCSRKVEEEFIDCAKKVLLSWYGKDEKSSQDITRIINSHHFNRLKKLLENTKGKIVVGGNTDAADLWISPTIVVDVKDSDVLMDDEIFGPILPIIRMDSAELAIEYLNARKDKPLSLYVFSQDKDVNKMFNEQTTSGTLTFNEVMLQCGWQDMPFGGVGESGMGKYHGKFSYDTFTHKKGVLARDYSFITENFAAIRYPPYNSADVKLQFLYLFLRNLHYFNIPRNIGLPHLLAFVFGAVFMLLIGVLRC
ncbi:Aldehyde dehydrogenase family 3 member B1 [Orchesella cincta]|uniref:Aldehyde dehydrogenase n=1 Tax=Orchesella cincta TaxID=48709 RepID=A0A1D2NEY9_ORCCI|nr:Aldehyde dehydrogenase family 3 member B1 [Orchesella cincta]